MKDTCLFIPKNLTIEGGHPVKGEVEISGAKNAILGLMAAALLTDEKVFLSNVPYISDVLEMGHILVDLGVRVKYNPETKVLLLHAQKIKKNILSDKALKLRASYYLWGALLARFKHTNEFKELKVLVPGGCSFGGKRPTDFHEQLIKNIFGAHISEEKINGKHYLNFRLPDIELKNNQPIYTTAKVSHGATFHWLLSIAGTQDVKMMYNSSLEPEVSNLIDMLKKMGLNISGSERTGLIYSGKNQGLLKGGCFEVIPDRLEAGTYVLLALGTKGTVRIKNINLEHCAPWLKQLTKTVNNGIYYSFDKKDLIVDFREVEAYEGSYLQMSPFPGFETDLQQIWTPILGLANSDSMIVDMIWPGRIAHLEEMKKFGLNSEVEQIEVSSSQDTTSQALFAHIKPSVYHAAKTKGTDLRGTMAVIILSCMAEGKSIVENPSFALRGYPNLIENLKGLGINVKLSKEGQTVECLPDLKK
ncbi:MAG: hypothetical protein PHE89_01695 [Alphaproteobacteria bacterium]|nr:hypothetical protein [Alphaproteobacteria bacterium]